MTEDLLANQQQALPVSPDLFGPGGQRLSGRIRRARGVAQHFFGSREEREMHALRLFSDCGHQLPHFF